MRRVVSLYLPTWPTDLWRRRNAARAPAWDSPLVVAGSSGPRRVLVAVDRTARRLGLRPGMAVAHAQAAVLGLTVVEADPDADATALAQLGAWCLQRYSPLVALDAPDGLWVEIAGAAHLFQGEFGLIEDLLTRLAQRALSARASVADTPGAAWAVARFAPRERVVAPGCQAAAVAELPLRALRLPRETVDGLAQLGIERIGQLAAKPRAPLRLRFGPVPSLRLDQAFGHVPEPLAYLDLPEAPQARLAFAEPISAPETLARVTELLLVELCQERERRGLGAVHEGQLVLLAAGDPRELGRELQDRLDGATVGVARVEDAVGGVASAWHEARRTLTVLFRLGRTGEVADAATLGLARLLLGDNGPEQVDEFIEQALGPLLRYDAERETRLVETVSVWFAASGSLRDTAEQLHVHPNTVTQRLDRVGRLLGDGWREGSRRLEVQLALQTHQLRDLM